MKPPRATEEIKARAMVLLSQGLSPRIVGQRLGRDGATITAWAKAAAKAQLDCKKANG